MRPEEIRALGRLAGEAAAVSTDQVHQVHDGIAKRVWSAIGPASTPVRVIHDGIARGAYAATRELSRAVIRGGALGLSVAAPNDARSIERGGVGRTLVAALNGAVGDRMERDQNLLAVPMTVRHHGRDISITATDLRNEFPGATARLAVFVHGPFQTADAWSRNAPAHPPYGYRLQAELGYTPLYVRYNTGRPVVANGADLAQLLKDVVTSWPVGVQEIALFGHSAGGLVACSACEQGSGEWVGKVRHVVTLGTPHRGLSLERVLGTASATLARLPETRGIAGALSARSAGLRDLAPGRLTAPAGTSINQYFIAASVVRDPNSRIGRALGDLLVSRRSSWAHEADGTRMRFPVDHYREVGGVHHFDLLNHPAVYAQIRRWLTARPALPAPA